MESTQNQFTEYQVMKPYFSQEKTESQQKKRAAVFLLSHTFKTSIKIIPTFDWLKLQGIENIVWPKTRQSNEIRIVWINPLNMKLSEKLKNKY